MAFEVLHYFSLQSNFDKFSSFKHEAVMPYPIRPKARLKDKRALCIRFQALAFYIHRWTKRLCLNTVLSFGARLPVSQIWAESPERPRGIICRSSVQGSRCDRDLKSANFPRFSGHLEDTSTSKYY